MSENKSPEEILKQLLIMTNGLKALDILHEEKMKRIKSEEENDEEKLGTMDEIEPLEIPYYVSIN